MSVALDQQPSFLAALYFSLTPRRRKIIQLLFHLRKKFGNVFPGLEKICQFSGLKKRTLQDFFSYNEEMNGVFFTKSARFAENGRQCTNLYVLNKVLVRALEWLDIYGHLNASRSKFKKIISSMQNDENRTLPLSKTAPLYKDYSYKEEDMCTRPPDVPISSQLREFGGMPLSVRIYLTNNFSERVLLETKKSYEWWFKKTKIYNPLGAFIRIAQRTKKRLS
jgi:hypothetical protein